MGTNRGKGEDPFDGDSGKPGAGAGRQDDTRRKRDAVAGYEERLGKVMRAKAMTDTAAWGDLYGLIRETIAHHAKQVLDAEKPRDVVRHQEGVKILRDLAGWPGKAVEALADYTRSMPLFAREFKTTAGWNQETGRIELRETE